MKCIIICAGDFVPVEIPVEKEDLVIAVDGGLHHCFQVSVTPDLYVGDFDSLDFMYHDMIAQMEADQPDKVYRLPKEKDDTDTLFAIRLGLERGYRNFHFYGALGGNRMEHTIANIQCLKFLKGHNARGYLLSDKEMVTMIQNETTSFHKEMQGYLSVFSYGEYAHGVTIKNMKYEVEMATLKNDFPIGVSNEFIGKEGQVGVENGCLLLIVHW